MYGPIAGLVRKINSDPEFRADLEAATQSTPAAYSMQPEQEGAGSPTLPLAVELLAQGSALDGWNGGPSFTWAGLPEPAVG